MIETTRPATSTDQELYRHLSADDLHEAVSIVLKLRGETCNIDCLYCFEKRKESPGGATIDVADLALLGQMFGAKPLMVELHGGEPLTTPRERMREILDHLARMPTVVAVTLQTNGTLLDAEWIDLFDEHLPTIQFAVSLDGDPEANTWRLTYNAEQTNTKVEDAIRLLATRGRTVGVTTVVTSRAIGRCVEVMDYLTGFDNVRTINLIPCFDTAIRQPTLSGATRVAPSRKLQQESVTGPNPPSWATTPADYAEFVLEAAGYWIERGLWRRLQLAPVVAVIRRLRGLDVRNCHFNARKCDHVFTAYPQGRLGSCDELPWPQAQLFAAGSRPSLPLAVAAQAASPLLASARTLMAKCTTCDYRQTCGGGCVSHRISHIATHGHDDAYCEHRIRLVDGVAGLLAAPGHRLATCRTVVWSPQHPNTMRDVASFLHRWGDPDVERAAATLRRSSAGNINTLGTSDVCEADDLDPLHPQWREGIEAGVWPLVEAITRAGFVTYDSCQGHPTAARQSAMSGVRVGILPRDSHDAATISATLCHTVTTLRHMLPTHVRARACRGYLRCETTGRDHPVVDLRVEPTSPDACKAFYATRESSVQSVVSALAAASHADPGDGCACRPVGPGRTPGRTK